MSILVITTAVDPHLEMVEQYLSQDTVILDPHTNFSFSVEWNGDESHDFKVSEFPSSSISSVWFRKPDIGNIGKNIPVAPQWKEYVKEANVSALRSIFSLLSDKYWVSPYWAIMEHREKPLQLSLAKKLGFDVPRTLITNCEEKARVFCSKISSIVVKPLSQSIISDGNKRKMFYTTAINSPGELELSGLGFSPAIFQEKVNKTKDIRVTVVGNQVFACEITSHGRMSSQIDYRTDILDHDLEYLSHPQFPAVLSNKCISMLKECNLQYGAFDFVMDDRGKYWFLELNPNGQWAWIELATGLPIAAAIANILESTENRI